MHHLMWSFKVYLVIYDLESVSLILRHHWKCDLTIHYDSTRENIRQGTSAIYNTSQKPIFNANLAKSRFLITHFSFAGWHLHRKNVFQLMFHNFQKCVYRWIDSLIKNYGICLINATHTILYARALISFVDQHSALNKCDIVSAMNSPEWSQVGLSKPIVQHGSTPLRDLSIMGEEYTLVSYEKGGLVYLNYVTEWQFHPSLHRILEDP